MKGVSCARIYVTSGGKEGGKGAEEVIDGIAVIDEIEEKGRRVRNDHVIDVGADELMWRLVGLDQRRQRSVPRSGRSEQSYQMS